MDRSGYVVFCKSILLKYFGPSKNSKQFKTIEKEFKNNFKIVFQYFFNEKEFKTIQKQFQNSFPILFQRKRIQKQFQNSFLLLFELFELFLLNGPVHSSGCFNLS